MPLEVETRSLDDDHATAVGATGPYTVNIDRPASAGGGGLDLNGGELLYLAVAGCVSNDLFREAQATGIAATGPVRARGDFTGDPAVSTEITYEADVEGDGMGAAGLTWEQLLDQGCEGHDRNGGKHLQSVAVPSQIHGR